MNVPKKYRKKKHTKSVKFNVNIEGKGVVDRSSTVIAKDPEGKHFFCIYSNLYTLAHNFYWEGFLCKTMSYIVSNDDDKKCYKAVF